MLEFPNPHQENKMQVFLRQTHTNTISRTKHISITLMVFALCLFITTAAAALDEPSDQYKNIAPLPGAGIALNQEGEADGMGAMQINIPVAYTPGSGFVNLGIYGGEHKDSDEIDNGTGNLGLGLFTYPKVYVSAMQTSGDFSESRAISGQVFLIPETNCRPAFSIGVQDIFEKEDHNRAVYGVFTKSVQLCGRDYFATAGYGGGRFLNRPFAGLSTPLNEHVNLAAEWDGYQMNAGIGWRPGGRDGNITILGARNFRTGWLIGIGAAFDLSPND